MDDLLRTDLIEELRALDARRLYVLELLHSIDNKGADRLECDQEITFSLVMANNLSDILTYLETPQPKFLGFETAVCWVLECLLEGDTYPTVLVNQLEEKHPGCKLSETVLQKAINFLDQQNILTCYTQRTTGRGRPRRMLSLNAEHRRDAEALAEAFQSWAV